MINGGRKRIVVAPQPKTTLIYDLTDENSVREYFQQQHIIDINNLSTKDKARLWLDKLLCGEIDIASFKQGMEFLQQIQKKEIDDFAYM